MSNTIIQWLYAQNTELHRSGASALPVSRPLDTPKAPKTEQFGKLRAGRWGKLVFFALGGAPLGGKATRTYPTQAPARTGGATRAGIAISGLCSGRGGEVIVEGRLGDKRVGLLHGTDV